MTIGIYSIVNKINLKRYIGLSVKIEDRIRYHKWSLRKGAHDNVHLQNAWNKYGEKNFDFQILETFDEADMEILAEKERNYIAQYDSFEKGYNRSLGGDGQIGFVIDKARLNRIKEKMKGNKFSLGRKASMSERKKKSIAFKNRKDHKQHSERGRRTLKRLWEKDWFRERQFALHMGNQYSKGRKHSEEFKRNLSEIRKGESNPFYNRKHSPETLKELSRINKERWEKEEYRNKVLPKRREIMKSDEYKKKMSKAIRGDKNGKSKTTEKDAIDIKLKYLNGMKLKELVEEYPIYTKSGIQKIYLGATWKHLPNTIEELEHMLINYQSNDESIGRFND